MAVGESGGAEDRDVPDSNPSRIFEFRSKGRVKPSRGSGGIRESRSISFGAKDGGEAVFPWAPVKVNGPDFKNGAQSNHWADERIYSTEICSAPPNFNSSDLLTQPKEHLIQKSLEGTSQSHVAECISRSKSLSQSGENLDSMDTASLASGNGEFLQDNESPGSLPSSLMAVKNLVRVKKSAGTKFKFKKSFEEVRLEAEQQEAEITEEARKAWEVGKQLGLTSKVPDEIMRGQFRKMEKEDRAKVRKGKKVAKAGAKSVTK